MASGLIRCPWAGTDSLYIDYHDTEWGVPERDDKKLFEFLILEGAQAGLSWISILRRREDYRRAFDGFDPGRIAGYDEKKIGSLLSDPGIVRNRRKIEGAVKNARAYLSLRESGRVPVVFCGILLTESRLSTAGNMGRVPPSRLFP